MHCGIVSVPEPGFSPYTFAGVRGPVSGGTFLSSDITAGSRPSSLMQVNAVLTFKFTDNLNIKKLRLEIKGKFMKRELIDILCCPMCKGDLELDVTEENEKEIVRGNFHCKKCSEDYPIDDGIPNMLPPELRE